MTSVVEKIKHSPSNKIVGIVTLIAAVLSIIVSSLMRPVETELMSTTGYGVIELEFAWTVEQIDTIFDIWNEAGSDLISKELSVTLIDMVFLVAYSFALAGLTLFLTRKIFLEPIKSWGYRITILPFVAAIFDFIENMNLILMLSSPSAFPDFAPFLASVCALIKFGLLGVTIVFWIVGIIHYFVKR